MSKLKVIANLILAKALNDISMLFGKRPLSDQAVKRLSNQAIKEAVKDNPNIETLVDIEAKINVLKEDINEN